MAEDDKVDGSNLGWAYHALQVKRSALEFAQKIPDRTLADRVAAGGVYVSPVDQILADARKIEKFLLEDLADEADAEPQSAAGESAQH